MPRVARRSLTVLFDLAVLSAAYWFAYLLRFDGEMPWLMVKRLFFTWPYVVAFQYLVLWAFDVPRFAWRYVSLREAWRVLVAVSVATATLLAVRFGAEWLQREWGYARYALVPIGVIVADAGMGFIGIIGVRAARRLLAENAEARARRGGTDNGGTTGPARTLLIGAGEVGATVAKELAAHPDLGMRVVGFVDDDPAKRGQILHGIPVLGATDDLETLVEKVDADAIVITISSARGSDVRRIVRYCEVVGIQPKIVPALHELLDGRINVSRIRDVSIDDLLGREPVDLEVDLVKQLVAGKRVLVTGAGGSIGSELCRQLALLAPQQLILVERAEFNLFSIHEELGERFPDADFVPVVCDICDAVRVDHVFSAFAPQVVFHAAAHKHVPMMEWNPGEAVKNNVFGTRTVALSADLHEVEAFVMISTDKAVNPTSIMGATKRAAEMYIQALSRSSSTKYVAVRFGNVLGSAGSVVPTFKRQIEAGGPVTITHPDMKRYFMTIPEASQLVLQAAAMGQGGEIFVLDMGEPVKIADLADTLIRLSGLEVGVDVEIKYTGLRPGEKLFEELGFDAEKMAKTRHEKIYVGKLAPQDLATIDARFSSLQAVADSISRKEVRAALAAIVPEMQDPEQALPPPSSAGISPERKESPGSVLPGAAMGKPATVSG